MQNTLLLVDGSSYLYRAFHALPDLRTPNGEPAGAILGMVNMLRRLRHDYPASYIACVFDAKGKTFRDDLYSEYKATRSSMPEDLVKQVASIHKIVRALGWPIIMIEGVEADDVIGTLAYKASEQGLKTVVSTGDKDMAQLVNDQVTLVNTMSNEVLDKEGVLEKFGVNPERITDYLALIGDTSDNIPGVAKVGPKTALKWLNQYGTLQNVMHEAESIKGVVGNNLREVIDWLPTAHDLVTIRTNCALGEDFESIETSLNGQSEDHPKMREFFKQHGFRSLLRELGGEEMHAYSPSKQVQHEQKEMFAAPERVEKQEYVTILTKAAFEQCVASISQAALTAVDTETTSLDAMAAKLVGISLCTEAGVAAYIPVGHRYAGCPEQLDMEYVLQTLRPWLESASHKKVGQHIKYDSHIFANYGIELNGIAHDTLLQSYVLEAHKNHSMDNLALRHLDRKLISYQEICGKGASQIGFDEVDVARATAYAAEDADITFQLHQTLWPRIEQDPKLSKIYAEIELPSSRVLKIMERNGVLIDSQKLACQSHELGSQMMQLEKKAYELAGQPFNMNSPKQLGSILFEQLSLPIVKKTPSGAPSTDEEVLQKLAEDFPLPEVLLEYRGLAKLKSTYVDKLPKMENPHTHRVHTNYAQAVAVTGRLASNDPNLQNIPVRTEEGRRVREAFVAPEGSYIVSADYSQIELRIMAHISDDPNLLRAFKDGDDVHRATAAEIFHLTPLEITNEQRRYAKVINFGLIYGMSEFGLAKNLDITRTAARQYIDRYFMRYVGVANYMAEIRETAKSQGYVETVLGRRLWLAEINSPKGTRRQAAERAAINAPMQGTAADLIKLAMVSVQDWIEQEKLQTKLIMQVHDELVLEVPEAELPQVRERLPQLMSRVAELKVPLVVDVGVGKNWDEAH